MSNVLSKPESLVLTTEQKEQYDVSIKYFYKNFNKFYFIYNSPLLKFFFAKKRKEFLEKTKFGRQMANRETEIFKYKVAQAIANEDYSVNHLCHYTFIIEGKTYTYGIVEIDQAIFETAKMIKRNMKESFNNNVINLFNKEL